jgi:hypothetical protein
MLEINLYINRNYYYPYTGTHFSDTYRFVISNNFGYSASQAGLSDNCQFTDIPNGTYSAFIYDEENGAQVLFIPQIEANYTDSLTITQTSGAPGTGAATFEVAAASGDSVRPALQATLDPAPTPAPVIDVQASTISITNLIPGSYTLRVNSEASPQGTRPQYGETATLPFTVQGTPAANATCLAFANPPTLPITAPGKEGASVTIHTVGGAGDPLVATIDSYPPQTKTFSIADGRTTFTGLGAGVYTITIADTVAYPTGANCQPPAALEVEVPLPPLELGDQLSFVPWVQPQLMNDAQVGTGPRPTLKLGVRLKTDQLTTEDLRTTTLGQIYGPADVLGISTQALLATTPTLNASGFSPLQLASIEFRDEDFPWRYSTRKRADGTPLPWLQLLVLEASEYDALQLAGQTLPGIRLHVGVPYPSVADDQRMLWAHVQLNGSLNQTTNTGSEQPSASTIQTFVDQAAASPDLAYSRIFCPRRLNADTAYRAFLVPALEVSRLTGLGQDASGVALDQVADPTKDGKFPVYFQWQFSTGAEEDFESLLGQLHPANDATSTASAPTLGLTLPTAPATPYELPMPSLLIDEQAPALVNPPLAVASYLYQQLAPGQGLPGALTQPRPVVTPPLYGRAYMVTPTLLPPTA